MKKITGGVTTKYYYTGSVVLYTADADNNKISGNIATPSGEIIATRDYANATNSDGSPNTFANKYYFYHYDIRGSVTTLLKPDATFEQGYSYDEYGNATVENSASLFHNEMSYTGAISDSTTGLSYMNARYYNPATGTFTSQDTYYGSAYSPWTQHLYSYTGGNPVNYVDPTGHRYAEFATMEGEKTKVDPIASFSQANYDSYTKARDFIYGDSNIGSAVVSIIGTILDEGIKAAISSEIATLQEGVSSALSFTKKGAALIRQYGKDISDLSKLGNNVGKVLKFAPYIAYGMDVGGGLITNIKNGASYDRCISDIVWDSNISLPSLMFSLKGAIPGIAASIGTYFGFDVPHSDDGITLRQKWKDIAYQAHLDGMYIFSEPLLWHPSID